jgi:L-asparaginase/Glu-tRNA(Gln) amidotransferase subunit D
MCEVRSDGLNNVVDALIVAATEDIPEVTVLFNNKLWRGNRTIKMDNHGLDAFATPNIEPLAKLDISINGTILSKIWSFTFVE